jgi:hypothetical protein
VTTDLRVELDVADGRAQASLFAGAEWRRRFATASEGERRELVEEFRTAVRHELDELCHVLLFTGDPDAAASPR